MTDQKSAHNIVDLYDGYESVTKSFTRVSNSLINNMYRLRKYKPGPGESKDKFKTEGLKPTEMLVILHALKFKRGSNSVRLSSKHVAKCLGMDPSSVRRVTRAMGTDGLLKHSYDPEDDKFTIYDLKPLFQRLDEILKWDVAQKLEQEEVA